jgi:hypothetical protein
MYSEVDTSVSQGTCSVRKKKKKSKLYYSHKKALAKSRMRTTSNEYKFRGSSKLIDFGNVDVGDIAGVIDGVLQAI